MYAARTTPYQGSLMVAICDLDLIGRKIEQDGLVIDVTESYFKQEIIENEKAGDLLKRCTIANLVGEKIVGQALAMKMAKEASVKRISGVPFLMIFKFQQKCLLWAKKSRKSNQSQRRQGAQTGIMRAAGAKII